MWNCSGQNIQMTRSDFGIELPITVSGATFAAADNLRLRITKNGAEVLVKTFADIRDNTVALILTAAESDALDVGDYVWTLDWYQGDAFLCNVIQAAQFKVVPKG